MQQQRRSGPQCQPDLVLCRNEAVDRRDAAAKIAASLADMPVSDSLATELRHPGHATIPNPCRPERPSTMLARLGDFPSAPPRSDRALHRDRKPRAQPGRTTFLLALSAACVILVLPLLVVDVPPLLDYPNHLARAVALASPDDFFLARFYAPHWTIIPDLGIDLVLPPLLHVVPVHVAGRVAIAGFVLLPVLGVVAYSRAVWGQAGWWSLGAVLVAWNQASLLGFLNFTAGIGLGFLLAAAWVAWRDRHPWLALGIAVCGTPLLFFCHLMGLVCFGLLVGCYELPRLVSARNGRVARALLAALPFAIPVILYLRSPLGDTPGGVTYAGIREKAGQLIVPVENYLLGLDLVTAAVIAALLAYGTARAVRSQPLPVRVPDRHGHPDRAPAALLPAGVSGGGRDVGDDRRRSVLLVIGLTAALFLATPAEFKGVQHFDTRFMVILGFLVFAGLQPALPRPAYVAIGVLFIIRMTVLTAVWAGHAQDLADLRSTIGQVPPGSTVFLAEASGPAAPEEHPGRRLSLGEVLVDHMAALLPIERRAWWPFLFDNDSQQPIATREPFRSLALRTGSIAMPGELPTANLCGFGYVLLVGADEIGRLEPLQAGRLTLLTRSGFAALFEVDPDRCRDGAAPDPGRDQ